MRVPSSHRWRKNRRLRKGSEGRLASTLERSEMKGRANADMLSSIRPTAP